jgi:hypothetical protein
MANFTLIGTVDGSQPIERTYNVAAGTAGTSLLGSLVTCANGYSVLSANGGISAAGMHGLVVRASTETAGAAGTVSVLHSPAGLVLRGVPTTPANLATAVLFDRVTIDVSGTTQTVDEDDANGVATIIGYNTTAGTIDVVVASTM